MILQSFENPKRNRERDVNTFGGNTLGLLREVHNFVLFRIYGCVVQRSLNENINFVLYCFRKNYQSPDSQCQNHIFIANFRKLRFYQNKRLSLDRRCGVPNTFPTHNQTSRPKNQDFLPSTLDLEKCPFS